MNDKKHTYIIAELSANHNQDFEIAKKSVYAAKEAGADAIKLQTYKPETMTVDIKKDEFKAGDIWSSEYLFDLYKKAYMPWEWQKELKKIADEIRIDCFSSPFDLSAVDFLESIDVKAYKIASFEISDLPLIKACAKTLKPIIISTGLASLEDIQNAVDMCRSVGNYDITLLKCTSAYPAPLEEANLNSIKDLKKRFNVNVGYSDHTLGITASVVAVSLGAKVIEKHFMLDKSIKSADSSFSLDKDELKQLVKEIRQTEKLLGKEEFCVKENKNRYFTRSLYAIKDIKKGELLSKENIKSLRPNLGLAPKYYEELLGKEALEDISYGTPLKQEFIKDFKEEKK